MEKLSEYLDERIKFIKFTNNHEMQDKKEWISLRNDIDLQKIYIRANDMNTAIRMIEKLIMLGYDCVAYDVLQENKNLLEFCFQFGNANLSKECYSHMLDEYRKDMNIKFIYDFFNKKEVS